MLPSPAQILGHPKFPTWYEGQDRIYSLFMDWMASDKRFLCASIPTGSGKTLLAALLTSTSGRRSVMTTPTKGLQSQILDDFKSVLGMEDIRGQNSFPCILTPEVNVDDGPCHAGAWCSHKAGGCLYYDQLTLVKGARSVVTNPSYYLAQTGHADGIGPVPLLIVDEAHLAFKAIEGYLQVYIGRDEIESIGARMPRGGFADWDGWKSWAYNVVSIAKDHESKLKQEVADSPGDQVPGPAVRAIKRVSGTVRKLESVYSALGPWVWESKFSGFQFTPVWPGRYSQLLWRDSGKVLLMSASLTPKTVQLLGVPEDDMLWLEVPSYFPPENTPITHLKTIRVDHKSSDVDMRQWVTKIDQVLDRRTDKKGIMFPVSYDRRNFYMAHSRHQSRLWSHSQEDVVQVVNRFKQASPPATLVSPSVTGGWDFPEDECRYIIIGKIPFGDGRSSVNKARQADDPEWGNFEAMQTIVQESGRGTRSEVDGCEVIIVDDHWTWFWRNNKHFAPQYFHRRVTRDTVDLVDHLPRIGG